MTCTELETPVMTLPDDPSRPKGLHVSQIIGDICRRMDPGRYAKHDADGKPVPMDVVKVQAGLNYERELERLLIKAQVIPGLFRPTPIQKDGIWGSPDGIDPTLWAPVEYKLTWYSSNKLFPDDPVYWPWVVQIKSYCHLIEATHAVLYGQWINGDYHPPRPGPPRKFVLAFTRQEVTENWTMLVTHAKAKGWLS